MPKTDDLPGVEGEGVAPKRIKALDNACGKWRAIVTERQLLTEKECEARDKVLALMHDKGVTSYLYRDNDVDKLCEIIPGKEKVKLKSPDDDNEGEE